MIKKRAFSFSPEGLEKSVEILKTMGGKVTLNRAKVLALLMANEMPLSNYDVESYLGFRMGRVAVYRALGYLSDSHIVRKIIDQKGTSRFLFVPVKDHTIQPYFHCKNCGKILSMPALPNEYLKNLSEYLIDDLSFTMTGICGNCQKKDGFIYPETGAKK